MINIETFGPAPQSSVITAEVAEAQGVVHGEITGGTRYRNTLFGKVILQVEFWETEDPGFWRRLSTTKYGFRRAWRDAKVTDLRMFMLHGMKQDLQ